MAHNSSQLQASFVPSLADIRVLRRRDFLVASAALAAGACLPGSKALAEAGPGQGALTQDVTDEDRKFMSQAIQLMRQAGVVDKTGGPFGCVIVRNGEVIAATGNSVIKDSDPTAHAEVNAVRAACRKIGNYDLSGATMYSSCECCPMCYSTAFWARIGKIFYAASWSDYADLFDDANLAADLAKPYPQRALAPQQILRGEADKVWDEFRHLPDGARY
jgi:guanine deaminase